MYHTCFRAVTLYDRPPLRFQAVNLTSQHEVSYACFSFNKINIVQHCVHFIVLLLFLLHGKFSISHSSVDSIYVAHSAENENGYKKSGWNIDILIFRNTLVSHLKFGEETLETPIIYTNNTHNLN